MVRTLNPNLPDADERNTKAKGGVGVRTGVLAAESVVDEEAGSTARTTGGYETPTRIQIQRDTTGGCCLPSLADGLAGGRTPGGRRPARKREFGGGGGTRRGGGQTNSWEQWDR